MSNCLREVVGSCGGGEVRELMAIVVVVGRRMTRQTTEHNMLVNIRRQTHH